MATTIASIQIENLKRVKAVHLEPTSAGLTVIGGRNGEGKTSVLDAIAWALGGARQQPSQPHRDGSVNPPMIDITLSNGLHVRRAGKNSALTVVDPSGKRAGQSLLDEFVSEFAIDLPKFMNGSSREKAQTLLGIIGIGDKLAVLDNDEKRIYQERLTTGQIADQKRKYADELPEFADAPDEPVSISELIQRQQAILAQNGDNIRKRDQLDLLRRNHAGCCAEIARVTEMLRSMTEQRDAIETDIATAEKSVVELVDQSTADIEASIANIESINHQVAANQQKIHAATDAAHYTARYSELTQQIEVIRTDRMALLDGADLPLPGLAVQDGELMYNGKAWDCMSGSEQLRVAVAIVRRLQPQCGFVLLDKLEQMDIATLSEFAAWVASENMQVIATRVSTGDECSIIIEDGLPQGQTYADVTTGVSATTQTSEEW